jgi:Fe-S cluster assembly iron-binding protein IscA
MALDGPKEDDEVFKEDGNTFIINKQLFEEVNPVTVDFVSTPEGGGFKISSKLTEENKSCGSCSC